MPRVYKVSAKKNKKSTRPRGRMSIKAMRRVARAEIHRMVEDKEVRGTANLPLGGNPDNYLSFTANNILDCNVNLVGITQGTGQGNRIGNRIRLRKFMLRGSLFYQSGIDVPQLVKIWIVSSKTNPNGAIANDVKNSMSALNDNNWFQDGNGASATSNNLRDAQLPINDDIWTLYATRTYKVANAGAPQGATPGYNNDFKSLVNYKINLLKYHPKVIKYNDNSTAALFNRKLFVVYQCINANGSTQTATTATVGHIRTLEMKFEDM